MNREQQFLEAYHQLCSKYGFEFVVPNQIISVDDDVLVMKRQPKIQIQAIPGWEPSQSSLPLARVEEDVTTDDK